MGSFTAHINPKFPSFYFFTCLWQEMMRMYNRACEVFLKAYRFFIVVLIFGLTGCSSMPKMPQTLTVFAAASLNDAYREIGKAFQQAHPGTVVQFNFNGSQILSTQLQAGAPADVFASANAEEMGHLIDAGLVAKDTSQIFIHNRLVVILPQDNPAGLSTLADLARPGLKLVLAAEDVPAGKYARQALENLNAVYGTNYQTQVLANLVSNETDVRQVVTKVGLGEADAGIAYRSDITAAPALKTIDISDKYNVTADYPIAPLNKSAHLQLAVEFIQFVLSVDGQTILQKWGFIPLISQP
jgi:molybdate transport system substrate-binding protein